MKAQGSKEGQVDAWQVVFLLVGLFDLVFFMSYLFLYAIKEQNTISDTLFSRGEYAVVLTVTLSIRLLCGVIFLTRYIHRHPTLMTLGICMEGVALIGWLVLVINKDMPTHFLGVGIFCLTSFVYSCVFLVLGSSSHKHLHALHQWLMIFLLVTTGVLVVSFVAIWAVEENTGQHASNSTERKAYIVEHAAYISHILLYLGFFSFHKPYGHVFPSKSMSGYFQDDSETMMTVLGDDTTGVSVCQPLISGDRRLPPIIEVVCEQPKGSFTPYLG
jgi:heme/copper-type cytochrome/quinol oxidase subunit 2